MFPMILAGVGLGLLVSGCASQNRKRPQVPGQEPLSQPKYREDLQAESIYLDLIKKGYNDSQLDQGCPTYQFQRSGDTFIEPERGKDDHSISACEVYEFTLNHWQDKKVRPLAEKLAGKPIPWSLDDFDDDTSIDEKLRKKIGGFIQEIEKLLKTKGFVPGTPAYQERLAVSLFVWIEMEPYGFEALMKDPNKSTSYKQAYQDFKDDLEKLGLGEIWEKIKMGGLHFSGQNKEYSAIQALQEKTGECTEHSKVLFAAFTMAGLNPFFIVVGPGGSQHPELNGIYSRNLNYHHILVGLNIHDRTRLFDGALIDLDPPHTQYLQLSLRQYLSIDMINRGSFHQGLGSYPQALAFYDMAKVLDPRHPSSYLNSASLYEELGKDEKMMAQLNALLDLNPYEAQAYGMLGDYFFNRRQLERSIENYNQAIQLQPTIPNNYIGRAVAEDQNGESEKAVSDLVKALQLAPFYSYKKIAEIFEDFIRNGLNPELMNIYRTVESEIGNQLVKVLAHVKLSNFLFLAGQKDAAREIHQKIANRILARKAKLKLDWSQYSPYTVQFIHDQFGLLIPDFKNDPEMIQIYNSLQLPAPPQQKE